MPTASSAQISNSTINIAEQAITLLLKVLSLLMAKLMARPVSNNRTPIIKKSELLQFTSFETWFPTNGMSRMEATTAMIIKTFFLFVFVLFNY